MDIPDLSKLGNAADIQAAIDAQIASRGLGAYVDYVHYVPQGEKPADDATHVLELASLRTEEAVIVALKVKPLYAMVLDGLLAVL